MNNTTIKPKHIAAAFMFTFKLAFRLAPVRTMLTMIITVALGISPAAEALVIREIVNNITTEVEITRLLSSPTSTVILLAIVFFSTSILSNIRHRLVQYINAWTTLRIEEKLIDDIGSFAALSFYDAEFNSFLKLVGDRGQRVSGIISDVTGFISWVISLLSVISLLAFVNPWIAVFSLIGSIPQTIYMQKSFFSIVRKGMKIAELVRLSRHYMDSFTLEEKLSETKVFDSAQFFMDKIKGLENQIAMQSADEKKRENLSFYGFTLLSAVLSIVSQIIIIRNIGSGVATIGDYMLYNTAHHTLFNMFNLFVYYYSVSKKTSGIALMQQFLKNDSYTEDIIDDYIHGYDDQLITSIRFEDVCFSYDGPLGNMIIKNLSFEIKKGETLALVGENGGGKTTLAKLICGLYKPTSGTISYNGVAHTRLSPEKIRKKFSIILQDYCKYGLTLGENVTFLESYDSNKIADILNDVGFDGFSNGHSLDSIVLQGIHDGGANFSEGQWQKIAIARSLCKPADIIVMDEPSAALDAKAEDAFYKLIKENSSFSIKILISHRLACIQDVDRVLVLSNGVIEQDGAHQNLVMQDGTYKKLFTIQSQKYETK
ncbi:MAG: ABC transporter ATP-binding protein/permease [Defluviitaleaceae bacterium]|nr:ABC transporter ATP-binding protein/permease [Defluviitaleaceae bacterium]